MTAPGSFPLQCLLGLCLVLAGCMSFEPRQLPPSLTLSPEDLALAASTEAAAGVDFGLTVGSNESDSLTNVATLPGVRIRAISRDSPAAVAGLLPGDVILSVDGLNTDSPDAFRAIALDGLPGQHYRFQLRRNTAVLETSLVGRAAAGDVVGIEELYRVDPVATRSGLRTEIMSPSAGPRQVAARVMAFYPDSTLPAAGVRLGDQIVGLDGQAIGSAQDLINRLNSPMQPGREVVFSVVREGESLDLPVRLWDPGRRMSRLALGPLLRYESTLSPDRTSFSLVDLWLFAAYRYSRSGSERQHSLFGLFNFSTDYGALLEE